MKLKEESEKGDCDILCAINQIVSPNYTCHIPNLQSDRVWRQGS
jgi:hypothetical protein